MIRTIIVDDDPFVRMSLETILKAQDDIEVCALGGSGDEAVALFERECPDVLLMDIQMPGSGGLDAAERILAAHPDARIVFLTTFSDDEYIMRALRLGAKGYLIKQEVATIAPSLRTVMTGQNVLGTEVVDRMDALVRARVSEHEECGTAGECGAAGKRDGCIAAGERVAPSAAGERVAPNATSERRAQCTCAPDNFGAASETSCEDASAYTPLTERECAIVELAAQGLDNREIAEKLYLSEGTVRNHMSTILQKWGCKNRTQLVVRYYRNR